MWHGYIREHQPSSGLVQLQVIDAREVVQDFENTRPMRIHASSIMSSFHHGCNFATRLEHLLGSGQPFIEDVPQRVHSANATRADTRGCVLLEAQARIYPVRVRSYTVF
ncbi:hypothetical protein SERLADRAFT_462250 [Serpula lacrymans var. lacrymans S7.9]|uniref:Uncharacterized protein n=1 Tax=Serpula lacrymans var. lacrymans (strain S7.9) TaxID=578457 RepID=F8NMW8_SERL9|nr:uncharacterized protein SERLADRAFT_462250 [Serpula lacrymans var. lacrymans S7.9]EGO27943.1 hypothetical protein SERLADRAFT_462250 [Serpula lacrymans var. lacrymans S7.9]